MDKGCSITGVAASSLREVQEAVNFAAEKKIHPVVHIRLMEEAEDVFKDLVSPLYQRLCREALMTANRGARKFKAG